MRICPTHWTRLREAINARGLGHLVAANGRDAHARAVGELKGTSDISDYDPLMAAHNMIVAKCLDWIGLGLMVQDESGAERCPLCEILKPGVYPLPAPGHRYKSNEEYFIDGPADHVLEFCQAHRIAQP